MEYFSHILSGDDAILSIEESDMSDGGRNGGEAEPITECKEYAEVDFAILFISVPVNLKLIVHN